MRERIIPDPIAFVDYHVNSRANAERLSSSLTSGSYRPEPPIRLLAEKSKGLCRQIVLPSIDDAIALQRLSDSFFNVIRGKTPSKNAYFEPDNFSFNKTDERVYGNFAAWLHFQKKLFEICHRSEFVVITDIANYYDYIGYVSLRNVIASNVNVPESVLDLLIFILSGLTWQPDYMPRTDAGIPQIDLDAPRVLAHSFLFDLDRYANKSSGDNYTRYMDDINFGVKTEAQGKRALRDVDLILHTRQVRLNSGKTHILSAPQAKQYFRIDDHALLDGIQAQLRFNRAIGAPVDALRQRLESLVSRKYALGDFDGGHGEKILKRLLTLVRQAGGSVHRRTLLHILQRRPGCRPAVLAYLAARPLDAKSLAVLRTFLDDQEIVDDLPFIAVPSTMLSMRVASRSAVQPALDLLIDKLGRGTTWPLHSALWLASKYATDTQLLNLLQRRRYDWFSDPTLGRMAGGMYPRFQSSPLMADYERLVAESGNVSTAAVYRFHARLARNIRAMSAILPYVRAPNPSRSTAISHEKFLLVLNLLSGTAANNVVKERLILGHRGAWRDSYYRRLAISAAPASLRPMIV